MVTHGALAAATRQALSDVLAKGRRASAEDVNDGHCRDFSDDVVAILRRGDATSDDVVHQVEIAMLMVPEDDGEPVLMDRDLLAEHWPRIVPPDGMDWDDVDRMAEEVGFHPGLHVWTVFDGRHYDAEAPDGVDNVFDLPFFRRLVAIWREGFQRTPRP